jgi:hypothetical protein
VFPLQELDTPPLNRNTTAFLYMNTNPNALQADPSLNISAPLHHEKQVSVWSWLPGDTANITSELYSLEILIPHGGGRFGLP